MIPRKNPLRKLIICLLAVTLAVSAGVMVVHRVQGNIGHKTYDEAYKIATQTEQPAPTPQPQSTQEYVRPELRDIPYVSDPYIASTLQVINLTSLQNHNDEILGWLFIPNTSVSYPFMQTDNNEFYLTHDWQKQNYIDGGIYVDCRNSMDGMDFNTIIYGHNKEDGYMFSDLVKYKKQDFYETHPYVYLHTLGGIFRYRIFSAHELEPDGYAYQLKQLPNEFLAQSMERNILKNDIAVDDSDRIITLSTCNSYLTNTRFVVQAVLDAIIVP